MSNDGVALSPRVLLADAALTADWQNALREIRVELQYQVPARCTLRFIDAGYVLSSSGKVSLGTSVSVKAPTDATTMITAEVTSVALEQRAGDQPELVVVAHDKSHRLGRGTNVKTYVQMMYSDVVSALAQGCGLTPMVDPTDLTVDYLMQADSDLGLLTELAHRVGFDWWVADGTLHFQKPVAGTTVTLTLADTLRAFSVRASGHHPDEVTVDGWDREQQELVTATSSASDAASAVKASSSLADVAAKTEEAFGSATLLTAGLSAHSSTEASQLSQAVINRAIASAVSAHGVAAGNPSLTLGSTAKVADAGPLSGSYPVTRVEHLFRPGSGFLTRFFCGDRRPATLVDTLSGGTTRAPATMHPGLSVGKVTNSNDPDNSGRVKVTYPGLSSQDETGWARLVAIGGGSDRGAVFIPEVGDEVLVAFEGGDPRQPVVIGGLYGKQATMPTTTVADGKVQQRGMRSRLGHVINLLDGTEPANEAIEIQLAGGEHTIHLGKDKLAITVPSGLPVEITAGDSSLKFGDDGALTITAPQITLTADEKIAMSGAQITANADASLSLQSDGGISLQGDMISLSSDGPLSAEGQPVMIN